VERFLNSDDTYPELFVWGGEDARAQLRERITVAQVEGNDVAVEEVHRSVASPRFLIYLQAIALHRLDEFFPQRRLRVLPRE
jgi:hypothetical protein